MNIITLERVGNKSGIAENGDFWGAFEIENNYRSRPQYAKCAICGEKILDGWQNADTGAEVCYKHIVLMV
jgi:hypothetical protein